ncbi:MAG: elongation factor P [Candidatus Eiseniibacteriota bacterium]|jgi:elongation factor P
MMIPATQLKSGMIIQHNGRLARIVDLQHVTPGKGRGMVQAKLRDVRTGVSMEYRFRSDERADQVSLEQKQMEYLYQEGEAGFCFMDVDSYEQITIPAQVLGDDARYLQENMRVMVEFHEHEIIGIELPLSVEFDITETAPPLKGATASGSLKPATLSNGMVVRVPEYMESGGRVRIDTRDGSFIERV